MGETLSIDWGEAKAEINLLVHGVSFGAAAVVLADPGRLALGRPGGRLRPERCVTVGRIDGRVVTVACDALGATGRRIVSARLATPDEWNAAIRDAPPPFGSVESSLSPADSVRLDRLDAGAIRRNADADPDNPPLSRAELLRAAFARRIRLIREATGLGPAAFARRFLVDESALRAWEVGLAAPDRTILAYLTVIGRAPELVAAALEDGVPEPAP